MEIIRITISFLAFIFTGYLVLSLIAGGRKWTIAEGVALVMTLGPGTLGILLFWLALSGEKPSFPLVLTATLASLAGSIFQVIRKKSAKFATPKKLEPRELTVLIPAALLWICLFVIVFAHSELMPVFDVDAFGLWGLKTKVLIHEGVSRNGYFQQLPLSYSHLDYPLMVPFISSIVYCAAYQTNDIISKLIYPYIFIAMTFLLYSSLRWKLERIQSILLMMLFLSMPALIRWTGAGIADVPLMLFYIGSVHYLVKYIKQQDPVDLTLGLLFTLFTSFSKNEGMAIAAVNTAVFLFFNSIYPFKKEKLKNSLIFAGTLLLLMSPWLIFSRSLPHSHENYTQRFRYFLHPENIERVITITKIFFTAFFSAFSFTRWGLLWILLVLSLLLNFKKVKEKHILAMWALFILHIAAYFAVFIISPWTPEFLAEMALERIILHAAPAALFLTAYQISR